MNGNVTELVKACRDVSVARICNLLRLRNATQPMCKLVLAIQLRLVKAIPYAKERAEWTVNLQLLVLAEYA